MASDQLAILGAHRTRLTIPDRQTEDRIKRRPVESAANSRSLANPRRSRLGEALAAEADSLSSPL